MNMTQNHDHPQNHDHLTDGWLTHPSTTTRTGSRAAEEREADLETQMPLLGRVLQFKVCSLSGMKGVTANQSTVLCLTKNTVISTMSNLVVKNRLTTVKLFYGRALTDLFTLVTDVTDSLACAITHTGLNVVAKKDTVSFQFYISYPNCLTFSCLRAKWEGD